MEILWMLAGAGAFFLLQVFAVGWQENKDRKKMEKAIEEAYWLKAGAKGTDNG